MFCFALFSSPESSNDWGFVLKFLISDFFLSTLQFFFEKFIFILLLDFPKTKSKLNFDANSSLPRKPPC